MKQTAPLTKNEEKGDDKWDFELGQTKRRNPALEDKIKKKEKHIRQNEHAVIHFRHFKIVQKLHNLLQKKNYKQVQS